MKAITRHASKKLPNGWHRGYLPLSERLLLPIPAIILLFHISMNLLSPTPVIFLADSPQISHHLRHHQKKKISVIHISEQFMVSHVIKTNVVKYISRSEFIYIIIFDRNNHLSYLNTIVETNK